MTDNCLTTILKILCNFKFHIYALILLLYIPNKPSMAICKLPSVFPDLNNSGSPIYEVGSGQRYSEQQLHRLPIVVHAPFIAIIIKTNFINYLKSITNVIYWGNNWFNQLV